MRGGEGYCRDEKIGGEGRGSKNNNTHPRLHFFEEGFPKTMMVVVVGRAESGDGKGIELEQADDRRRTDGVVSKSSGLVSSWEVFFGGVGSVDDGGN